MAGKADLYPQKAFPNQAEFESWLRKEHNSLPGVWVKFAKKTSGIPSVNYQEALDVALCYGWIDGQSKSIDERFYLQKFTPRGKRSIWSKRNIENVERLIKTGKMQSAGLAQIEAAKIDGRWDLAYDSPSTMEIPEDFLDQLKKDKSAYQFFLTLNKTNIYAICWRLQTAKKPETRQSRMKLILEMLKRNKKLY